MSVWRMVAAQHAAAATTSSVLTGAVGRSCLEVWHDRATAQSRRPVALARPGSAPPRRPGRRSGRARPAPPGVPGEVEPGVPRSVCSSGSNSSGPAWASPPPTATTSRSHRLAADAMARPRARPARRRRPGHRVRRGPRRRPGPWPSRRPGPAASPAPAPTAASAGPLAMASSAAAPAAAARRSVVAGSTTMCPMCPALPDAPLTSWPSRISPPPTPVETTMPSMLAPAPARAAPVLGRGQADRVVVHPHRQPRQPLGQPVPQREPAPAGMFSGDTTRPATPSGRRSRSRRRPARLRESRIFREQR